MLYIVLFLIMGSFLIVEKILHERRVKRIPIRIHVNGTRGKSSVTRLLAAALRENGIRTFAKTTGTTPWLMYPDGREEILSRRGPSRIQEQIRFIKKAAQMNSQAVVVECMAIDPQLQLACETQMIRSTLGVITNVRPDHFEVMGKNLDGIAESLSRTIPHNGTLVTGDPPYFNFFESRAVKQNTKAFLARGLGQANGKNSRPHFIFHDNFLIVAEVCTHLGVDLSPTHGLLPDGLDGQTSPGVFRIKNGEQTLYFIDAFSANDIASTKIIQQMSLEHCPRPYVALFNNRADRPLRMVSFATFLAQESIYDYILLVGDLRRMAQKCIRRSSPKGPIMILRNQEPEEILSIIYQKIPFPEFTVIGIGNYKGIGEGLSRLLLERREK